MAPSPTGRYTDQWWHAQFVGLQHTVNLLASQIAPEGLEARLAAAHRRIDELDADNANLRLAVGEANAKADAVTARLDALILRLKERFDKETKGDKPNAAVE